MKTTHLTSSKILKMKKNYLQIHIIIIILIFTANSSCRQLKEVQFGEYNMVTIGGLYGETLRLKPDSTFTFRTAICLSSTLAGGKFTQKSNRLFFYDIENLSTPIFMDSIVFRDTQYLHFPSGGKRIVLPPKISYRYYGNEKLSDRVPQSIKIKGNKIFMYDSDNRKSGVLRLFQKDKTKTKNDISTN